MSTPGAAAPSPPVSSSSPRRNSTHSSDRVELLINKYKRLHIERDRTSLGSSPLLNDRTCQTTQYSSSWNSINEQLMRHGYSPIDAHTIDNKNNVILKENEVQKLFQTVTTLLNDIQRKDLLIHELTATTNTTPTSDTTLQKQLKELQSRNAKLHVDRPYATELRACQQKVKELQTELQMYKNNKRLDNNGQLKSICTVLKVNKTEDIIPTVSILQQQLQQIKDIEPYMKSISSISSTGTSHSTTLCPTLWYDVANIVDNWKRQIDGLKELQLVFAQLYLSIEKREIKEIELTCKHMSDILESWLTYKSNKKSANVGVILAMVNHFQQLFDVSTLDGVYPVMSNLYSQLIESVTAHKQLAQLLGLTEKCSWKQLVLHYEKILEFTENKLYINICHQYGELTFDEIMQSLSLCRYFFPPFHSLITELQYILGVESLSAVIPEVKKLAHSL